MNNLITSLALKMALKLPDSQCEFIIIDTFDMGKNCGLLLNLDMKLKGFCWNPDTKKIERIIWTPKFLEEFYYIDMYFGLIKRTNYDTSDVVTRLIEAGNCFKDNKEAESVLAKIKNVFEQRRAL